MSAVLEKVEHEALSLSRQERAFLAVSLTIFALSRSRTVRSDHKKFLGM